jgi:glycosyltransferase involved in cell wall biosynthesis
MSYILKLAGWYPSKIDAFNGDFVQRHAQSIALHNKVIVVYVVKSNLHKQVIIEKNEQNNLIEYIGYYPEQQFFDTLQSQFHYASLHIKIIKLILKTYGKPKLTHVNIVWKAGVIALYLKLKYQLNYVITENWTGYYKQDPNFIGKANFIKKYLIKKVFGNAQHFLPVTQNLAITCLNLFYHKMPYNVVENAVDVTLFYPSVINKPIVEFIHISTMGHQKNTNSMLRVMEKIMQQHKCTLTLIGPYPNEIKNIIEASVTLKANTTLTGNIPYSQVAKRLQQASALVLFSRYENLPCVILESLCCGVPVVSTNVGGISEVINDSNGILVNNEDEIALENALQTMIQNYSAYNKNDISKDAILKYSYAAIGKKYHEAYKAILK